MNSNDMISNIDDRNSNGPLILKNKKTQGFVYVLTFFSAIGGFLFGYDTGVVSGAMILLKDQFNLNIMWQELIVAITVGFAAIFAFVGGPLNAYFGRKVVIMLTSLIFTTGAVVLSVANNKEMLLVGRAIVGIGIGLSSMTIPMYIAEVSPLHIRGRLVTINNLFITAGQFVAGCIDGIFSSNTENGWRYMLGLAAVPAVIQFVGFVFLPESPRWLIEKNRYDKAIKSLQRILNNDIEVQREFEVVRFAAEQEQKLGSNNVLRLISDAGVRRALVVGCGLQMFQQLAGINTVMYYSATIVQMSGIRSNQVAIWLAALTAFVNFVFTFVGVYLVEKMGRRLLTLISMAGVTFSLLFLSTGFLLSATNSPPVTINTTGVLNGTGNCYQYSDCNDCMRSLDCGYCYMPTNTNQWGATNSTCLPVNHNDPQVSSDGRCTKQNAGGPYFASNYCPTQFSWMAMIGMIVYLIFFAPGMGPMPWTINSEIYPQWARSSGNAFSTGTNWIFNVIISLTFLDVIQGLTTAGGFLLYACFAFLGFLFLYFLLPETKGKALEEVENVFKQGWIVPCNKEKSEYQVILNETQPSDDSDNDLILQN